MTGLGEDTLISAIEGLTTSMEDFDKWGNFASLGFNASDLQTKILLKLYLKCLIV
ncbi:hypothetical protein OFP91_09940 [Brachyspira hyodysenteriae]|uniref:hypothetical protein n=1 Tax=Brachyspira hyodysenteriae TaxID=159 RepID=UPI0022CD863F|nr:hypothetical protein [Brachyspira hyodysenteriae]MCZ9878152.1 hypothetical protein [Brachyspira hyodysenteriae]MCZ9898354.1 hypothetical protein [Brachyspira hyodysenteriae]